MNQIRTLLLALLSLLLLTGCGAEPVPAGEADGAPLAPEGEMADEQEKAYTPRPGNLLETASPETSALVVYCFDGQRVTTRTLYETEQEQAVLKRLNALAAEPCEQETLKDWSLPCYGLWISDKEGRDLNAAWSNGIWLDREGQAWYVEADFAGLWEELEELALEGESGILSFPNAGYLADYNSSFLVPADSEEYGNMSPMELGAEMYVKQISDGIATLVIHNYSGHEIGYSEHFSLQKEVGGQWYILPVEMAGYGFNDVAYLLEDGASVEVTADLNIYGDLEDGSYRIVKDDLVAPFSKASAAFEGYTLR